MILNITADNLTLQGSVEKLVRTRLDNDLKRSLAHFPDDIKKATVRVVKQSHFGYKVTFEMQLPGLKIYSEESHKELPTALLILRDEVKRQILKHKEKLTEVR